jgi:hypothetical protein
MICGPNCLLLRETRHRQLLHSHRTHSQSTLPLLPFPEKNIRPFGVPHLRNAGDSSTQDALQTTWTAKPAHVVQLTSTKSTTLLPV